MINKLLNLLLSDDLEYVHQGMELVETLEFKEEIINTFTCHLHDSDLSRLKIGNTLQKRLRSRNLKPDTQVIFLYYLFTLIQESQPMVDELILTNKLPLDSLVSLGLLGKISGISTLKLYDLNRNAVNGIFSSKPQIKQLRMVRCTFLKSIKLTTLKSVEFRDMKCKSMSSFLKSNPHIEELICDQVQNELKSTQLEGLQKVSFINMPWSLVMDFVQANQQIRCLTLNQVSAPKPHDLKFNQITKLILTYPQGTYSDRATRRFDLNELTEMIKVFPNLEHLEITGRISIEWSQVRNRLPHLKSLSLDWLELNAVIATEEEEWILALLEMGLNISEGADEDSNDLMIDLGAHHNRWLPIVKTLRLDLPNLLQSLNQDQIEEGLTMLNRFSNPQTLALYYKKLLRNDSQDFHDKALIEFNQLAFLSIVRIVNPHQQLTDKLVITRLSSIEEPDYIYNHYDNVETFKLVNFDWDQIVKLLVSNPQVKHLELEGKVIINWESKKHPFSQLESLWLDWIDIERVNQSKCEEWVMTLLENGIQHRYSVTQGLDSFTCLSLGKYHEKWALVIKQMNLGPLSLLQSDQEDDVIQALSLIRQFGDSKRLFDVSKSLLKNSDLTRLEPGELVLASWQVSYQLAQTYLLTLIKVINPYKLVSDHLQLSPMKYFESFNLIFDQHKEVVSLDLIDFEWKQVKQILTINPQVKRLHLRKIRAVDWDEAVEILAAMDSLYIDRLDLSLFCNQVDFSKLLPPLENGMTGEQVHHEHEIITLLQQLKINLGADQKRWILIFRQMGFDYTRLINGTKMKMIYCPAGCPRLFEKGIRSLGDINKRRQMIISNGYWLGQTTVTQALWKSVMKRNPSRFKGDNHPVEMVSWFDCLKFCNALSRIEGLKPAYTIKKMSVKYHPHANGYRLPFAYEWEYAARADTEYVYAGSDVIDDVGWYRGNSGMKTHEVAQLKPNSWGLYDMSGNVWEWCQTYPQKDISLAPNHYNSDEQDYGILCGGRWYIYKYQCEVSSSTTDSKKSLHSYNGLRVLKPQL